MKYTLLVIGLLLLLSAGILLYALPAFVNQQPVKVQSNTTLVICDKPVIDYGTVVSVPTGCLDSTGKSIPCCLNSSGQAIVIGQKILPDSSTIDSTGHLINQFTVCSGEQVQWHTNVGTCP